VNEEQRRTVLQKGDEARALMQNPALRDAFLMVEQAAMKDATGANSPEEAWMAICQVRAVRGVWQALSANEANGRAEAESILRENQKMMDRREDLSQVQEYMTRAARERARWDWRYDGA
jgi:hypothetical protein